MDDVPSIRIMDESSLTRLFNIISDELQLLPCEFRLWAIGHGDKAYTDRVLKVGCWYDWSIIGHLYHVFTPLSPLLLLWLECVITPSHRSYNNSSGYEGCWLWYDLSIIGRLKNVFTPPLAAPDIPSYHDANV